MVSTKEEEFARRADAEERLFGKDFQCVSGEEDLWEDPGGHVMEFHQAYKQAFGEEYDAQTEEADGGAVGELDGTRDDEESSAAPAADTGESIPA